MTTHRAEIIWERGEQPFTDNRYSRRHRWRFDGGSEVLASSSPAVVPLPYSLAEAVDPEEAYVAALSSCHMLWFLSLAAKAGWVVDDYRDDAEGRMEADGAGREWIAVVTLQPAVRFSGARTPTAAEIDALHHEAHTQCFLANSVRTDIRCQPRIGTGDRGR